MNLYTKNNPLQVTPWVKPPVVEPFIDRMREFENSMMRNVYDLFTPITESREIEGLFGNGNNHNHVPVPIELRETDEGFVLYAEVPGFKEKEIEVQVEAKRLFLTGKKEEVTEERKGKTVYSERTYNQFARSFELPVEIEPEKAKATLKNGRLELTLVKVHSAKKVPVLVRAA